MKHPVTKQKRSASRQKRQYTAFANLARKKLFKMAPLVNCPHCQQKKINHHVCPQCGYYGDREVVKKGLGTPEKVTTVKV